MSGTVTRLPSSLPQHSNNVVELAIEAFSLCERIRCLDDPLLTALFEMACQGVMESLNGSQQAEVFSRTTAMGIGPYT